MTALITDTPGLGATNAALADLPHGKGRVVRGVFQVVRSFVLRREDVPQRRVTTNAVVKHLHLPKQTLLLPREWHTTRDSWWTSSRFRLANVLSTTALSQYCPTLLMLPTIP